MERIHLYEDARKRACTTGLYKKSLAKVGDFLIIKNSLCKSKTLENLQLFDL
jgi:hypothetical protein